MATELRAVTVFCGSSAGTDPAHATAARQLGTVLASRNIDVIYGGGNVGLMGILADAALAADGRVVGVIPRHLWDKEVGHDGLSELLIVDSMHERKLAMADRGDAFIALPGGVGTFEELFEAVTWTQLGIHDKPVGLLDVSGYYQLLLRFLDQATDAGFLRRAHRDLIADAADIDILLEDLAAWSPVDTPKWLTAEER